MSSTLLPNSNVGTHRHQPSEAAVAATDAIVTLSDVIGIHILICQTPVEM